MQLTGFCRFSWFGISDTGRSIQTEEDAMRVLYDPARLAARFHLFENLAAPSILHQTDPDFDFIVITSPLLPAMYMQRLEKIVDAVPQMRLVVTTEQRLDRVTKPLIRERTNGYTETMAGFRLDDDDALSVRFVAQLRRASKGLAPGHLVTFPTGLYAFQHPDGAKFGPRFKPYIACGLTRLNGPAAMRDVFLMQHLNEYKHSPSYMDPRFTAYLTTAHGYNISGAGKIENDRSGIIRYLRNTPELADARWTDKAAAAIATDFPFLTPDSLLRILDEGETIRFDPDRPLPDALRLTADAT